MDNYIVTISREYGSGGRQVGELLAKELGIPFYDREILQMSAEKSGMSADFLEKRDEVIQNTFLHNLMHATYPNIEAYYETPITDKVFQAQSSVIRDIAAQGSCVIVGRCADYVLRDNPSLVTVFVRAALEDRIRQATAHYDMPPDKAAERIKKIDKQRANYYKYYTTRQWGSMSNFDLIINSSFTGIDGAVAVIKTMLEGKNT
ncbi:MAG: cytidylate kinase-like family protein [Oscillospiraceae bacterium]|nr:cytidylate kinase-like family protein [Oscillospiraceae bacterium]